MGDWDGVFDETYLQTYLPSVDPERTRAEALGAAELAGVEPGAEILDCPTGFGRHALVLAEEGYRVTAWTAPPTLLAEAESRRGAAEWPRLVRGDYRELPFEDASFDAVFNLFSSLGYLERDEDVGVLREFRRVLRPGRALVMETAHRDGFARFAQPFARRTWDRLPDGSLYLEERTPDWSSRNDRHVPRDHQPRGRADRAPVPPPRVLGEGVDRDAAGGRLRRHRGVRRLGRRDACHARRLATDPSRPLRPMD